MKYLSQTRILPLIIVVVLLLVIVSNINENNFGVKAGPLKKNLMIKTAPSETSKQRYEY